MRESDRLPRLPLRGQQRYCLQVIAENFGQTGVTVEKLRKYIEEKPRKLRQYLSDLVMGGYVDGETFLLTEKGKEIYEEQRFWKKELIWWMRKLRVPEELIESQTDTLMDTAEPEVIQKIYIQNEYIRTLEINRSSQETIYNSDLSGRLGKGVYKARIFFLDPGRVQGESAYQGFSRLNQYFSSQAELMVESLGSCMILDWETKSGTLMEATYLWEGKKRNRKAQEGKLVIPIADIRFTYVRTYGMLEGRLDMTVKMADHRGIEESLKACLMISLPINPRR